MTNLVIKKNLMLYVVSKTAELDIIFKRKILNERCFIEEIEITGNETNAENMQT